MSFNVEKTKEEIKAEEAAIKADFKRLSGVSHNKHFVLGLVGAVALVGGALYFILFS